MLDDSVCLQFFHVNDELLRLLYEHPQSNHNPLPFVISVHGNHLSDMFC